MSTLAPREVPTPELWSRLAPHWCCHGYEDSDISAIVPVAHRRLLIRCPTTRQLTTTSPLAMSRRVYQNTGNEFSSRGLGSPGFGLLGGDDDDGLGIMGTHVNASRREASSRRMSAGPAYGRRSTGNLAASGMAVAGVSGSPSMRRPRRRSHTSSVPELQSAFARCVQPQSCAALPLSAAPAHPCVPRSQHARAALIHTSTF